MRGHSVLIADRESDQVFPEAFLAGAEAARELAGNQLLHALFATRARQLVGELPAAEAASYLSGLLVGADVYGALELLRDPGTPPPPATLIGDPRLTHNYRQLLEGMAMTVQLPDPTDIAIHGYAAVYQYLNAGAD